MEDSKKGWSSLSTKEKLDYAFVVVAIIGFSLGALVNYKLLTKK